MSKIAIITPGGDAPGMNACIRAIVRAGISEGMEIFGIYYGYSGLLREEIYPLALRSVSGIVHRGGTILKSSRCQEIKTTKGINKAVAIFKKHEIDYLVIIGGDGSLRAGEKIARHGIPVIGIPASIDNDIYGTDESIGFDTAIDTAVEAIDKIRDTAISFERVFIVEVMGREHGFLALAIGLASGAEFILIPEIKFNISKICQRLRKGKEIGKTSWLIIYAEGCGDPHILAKKINQRTKLETRVSSLGYIQRGGRPYARSRILASQFGAFAIKLITKKIKNQVVVLRNGKIKSIPLSLVVKREKSIDASTLKLADKLAI